MAAVPSPRARIVFAVLVVGTFAQLLVATTLPDLPQFAGKAFGARLVFYPLLMLLVPAAWFAVARARGVDAPIPWVACAWIALPFAVDVAGNTLDLYDRIAWWDDLNHLVNWLFLCLGVGLLLARAAHGARWVLAVATAGVGALLAVGWEAAEWWTFIRHGTELDTAYTDTLGDLVLGTSGGIIAALIVAVRVGGGREARGA